MSTAALNQVQHPPEQAELVPTYFDTDLVVTPDDNPAYSPAMLADLLESMREHGQLVPGWVCPSPDLPPNKRLCIEGNRRLAVSRMLGLRFWAFNLSRDVREEERIRLMFHHHGTRRRWGREEIAERAGRYIELTGCTAADAAKLLNVSGPTLSRAFGDRRIPPELKPKADGLGLSIRSLVAAVPLPLMDKAIAYAGTPGHDGKKPTRDQVAVFVNELKKGGRTKVNRPKTVTLRLNGRTVSFAVGERDTASTVTEDFKALVVGLSKHADVPPDGWKFLFR
jgi:hypothetical protein